MTFRARTPIRGIPVRPGTSGRPRRPSEEHGWSRFEQVVLVELEGVRDDMNAGFARIDERVLAIELQRATEQGERKQRDQVWRWVLGVLAALAIAGIIALAKSAR